MDAEQLGQQEGQEQRDHAYQEHQGSQERPLEQTERQQFAPPRNEPVV
jgi:hypothetical protein